MKSSICLWNLKKIWDGGLTFPILLVHFIYSDPGTNNFIHHTKGINGLVVLTAKKFVEKESDKKKVITFTYTVIACEAHNVHFHFLFTENF